MDLTLLEGNEAASPDLRASLGRHFKRDFEKSFSYAQKWLSLYPQDLLLQEMILKSSLDVGPQEGLRILDDLLPQPTEDRLKELRIELRSKLDLSGTAEIVAKNDNPSPSQMLVLFEAGSRSKNLTQKLMSFVQGAEGSDALVLRSVKALLADPESSSLILPWIRAQLSSSSRSPDLRVAFYRLLESRADELLTVESLEAILASLPDNNKIQMTRALAVRCRGDRRSLLDEWSKKEEPVRSTARELIKILKTEDPCR